MGFKDFIEKFTHTQEDLYGFVKARPQQERVKMATLKALGTELKTHPFWHYRKLQPGHLCRNGKIKINNKKMSTMISQTDSTAFIHPFRPPKKLLSLRAGFKYNCISNPDG